MKYSSFRMLELSENAKAGHRMQAFRSLTAQLYSTPLKNEILLMEHLYFDHCILPVPCLINHLDKRN